MVLCLFSAQLVSSGSRGGWVLVWAPWLSSMWSPHGKSVFSCQRQGSRSKYTIAAMPVLGTAGSLLMNFTG